MRIYEIGTGYTPIPAQMGAATEIVVEQLTRSLAAAGEDVSIIDIRARNRAETDLPISEVAVPSIFTRSDVSLGIMHKVKRVAYSLALARKLKRLIRRSEERLTLHFHNQYNLYFFLKLTSDKLRRRANIIYTVHSYIWHGEWEDIESTVSGRYFQEVYCVARADRVFVLNEKTRENITEHCGVPSDKVTLIDNGVNTSVYTPASPERREEAKRARGLDGKRVFISVGSVCERKNQLGALSLMLDLMLEDDSIVYAYAGGVIDADYQASIESFAAEHGISDRVIYAGELEPGARLAEFYSMADVMLFPSRAEGFSLVIIEAMSSGVPVIIDESLSFKLADRCLRFSDKGALEHIVREQILQRECRERLSAEVREAVEREYSWDKVADDYLSAIDSSSQV